MAKRLIKVDDWNAFFEEHIYNRCFRNEYEQGYTDALDRVDDWMDTQPTVEGWIPVSERLPKNGQQVLKYHGWAWNPKISLAFYYNGNEKLYGWCDVTHWMPLPEPPKED